MRRTLRHSVYVVAWPDTSIVKAGYTSGTRWRKFLNRGAKLVLLEEHPTAYAATGREAELDMLLEVHGERAFHDRTESFDHVGSGGCGWSECLRIAPADYEPLLRLLRSESMTESIGESL